MQLGFLTHLSIISVRDGINFFYTLALIEKMPHLTSLTTVQDCYDLDGDTFEILLLPVL